MNGMKMDLWITSSGMNNMESKILKKEAVANELAAQMRSNMRPRIITSEEKIVSVLEHLNSAAEAFEEAGNDKFAVLVTHILTNFANKL